MTTLRLTLFGPPRLEREGQPVEVNRRKSLALLAYLAGTGQSHSRDTLATLFWPEVPQRRARGNLRRALSDLNREMGEGLLVLDGETVALTSENGFWSDVGQFRACLAVCANHPHSPEETCPDCLLSLTEAANLYQADFLAGFTLRDTAEFDDWQYFEAESLRQEYASVLTRLVNGLIAQADYEAAIPYARRWVALDRLHEPAHQQLMRLYVLVGRRHEALRQYRTCVEVLETELGISPSPETESLYQQIAAGDVSPPPAVTPKPAWLPPAPTAVSLAKMGKNEEELATAYFFLGNVYYDDAQHLLSENFLQKAQAAFAATGLLQDDKKQAAVHNLIGLNAQSQGAHSYAIEAFEKAIAHWKKTGERIYLCRTWGLTRISAENGHLK